MSEEDIRELLRFGLLMREIALEWTLLRGLLQDWGTIHMVTTI